MADFLRFKKSAVRPYVIVKVNELETGVGCFDNSDVMVGFIRQTNPALKKKIVDQILDCLNPAKKFRQPDWTSLEEPEQAV